MKKDRYVFKEDKNREAFQRWSDHRIDQLTAATTLVFGLVSAALGYFLALISDDKTPVEKLSTLPFLLSFIAFLISFIFGIFIVYHRLASFRKTCEIIKLRDKGDEKERLETLRIKSKCMDAKTWCMFNTQILSFAAGGFAFFVFVINSNFDRVKIIFTHLF